MDHERRCKVDVLENSSEHYLYNNSASFSICGFMCFMCLCVFKSGWKSIDGNGSSSAPFLKISRVNLHKTNIPATTNQPNDTCFQYIFIDIFNFYCFVKSDFQKIVSLTAWAKQHQRKKIHTELSARRYSTPSKVENIVNRLPENWSCSVLWIIKM